jgi:hypothetical protein
VAAVIADVVAQTDRFGVEDREWVDELEIDRGEGHATRVTLIILALATAALRTAPVVMGLNGTRPYGVHTCWPAPTSLVVSSRNWVLGPAGSWRPDTSGRASRGDRGELHGSRGGAPAGTSRMSWRCRLGVALACAGLNRG